MLALGAELGPRRAHELVHAAAARGHEQDVPFREALTGDPEIAARLAPERIEDLLRPETALGAADGLVDRIIGR
jgi:adenylosuccinate lyase